MDWVSTGNDCSGTVTYHPRWLRPIYTIKIHWQKYYTPSNPAAMSRSAAGRSTYDAPMEFHTPKHVIDSLKNMYTEKLRPIEVAQKFGEVTMGYDTAAE